MYYLIIYYCYIIITSSSSSSCFFLFLSYRPSQKKNALLRLEDTMAQHDAMEHTIVPLHEGNGGEGIGKQRFKIHHSQPTTRKIYFKDFRKHLQNMLDDSGYKFSEEYEVRGYWIIVLPHESSTNCSILLLAIFVWKYWINYVLAKQFHPNNKPFQTLNIR